jgi:hypothetical protein
MSFKTALAHSNSKANNNPFANIEIKEIFDSLVSLPDITFNRFVKK